MMSAAHGQGARDADPLALAAGELCGRRPAISRGRPTRSISSATWPRARALGARRWTESASATVGDGEPRVEGGEGVLEDHLGPAAEGKQILRRQARHILAREAHLAARGRGEAQDGAAQRALAAAALAHQAEGIALLDGEADAVDRADDARRAAGKRSPRPLARTILDLKPLDLEQRRLGPPRVTSPRAGMQAVAWVAVAGRAQGLPDWQRASAIAARMEAAAGGEIGQGGSWPSIEGSSGLASRRGRRAISPRV